MMMRMMIKMTKNQDDDDDDDEINLRNVEWEIGRRVCWNLSK